MCYLLSFLRFGHRQYALLGQGAPYLAARFTLRVDKWNQTFLFGDAWRPPGHTLRNCVYSRCHRRILPWCPAPTQDPSHDPMTPDPSVSLRQSTFCSLRLVKGSLKAWCTTQASLRERHFFSVFVFAKKGLIFLRIWKRSCNEVFVLEMKRKRKLLECKHCRICTPWMEIYTQTRLW